VDEENHKIQQDRSMAQIQKLNQELSASQSLIQELQKNLDEKEKKLK